jgi:hypothetical protein
VKNYFLSREAMSEAFDSAALRRVRTQADTKFALARHLRVAGGVDRPLPVLNDWPEVTQASLRIRALARKRTGSALVHLLGCIQDMSGEPDSAEVRWEGEAALLSAVSGGGATQASQLSGHPGWAINAVQLQIEDAREAGRYILVADTEPGQTAIFLIADRSPGVLQTSLDDGFISRPCIALSGVPTLHCLPVRALGAGESRNVIATLWFASLLCGMTDRLFSMTKALHTTIDPRQAPRQFNDPALQRCLARIDALLLTQEMSLRTMLTANAEGSVDLAMARSNSHRIIESAFQASSMVLRTLRDTQDTDLLDSIRLQVQAVTAIYGVSAKLVAGR